MPKITKISQQKRNSRVNIYLDDKFGFGLSKKTLVDFDLFVGKNLNQKKIKKILEKDQRIKALEKSFRLLGIRPRSQKELEKKLKEKGFSDKIIKETFKKLKDYGYLDDKKFAQLWLEMKKLSGKGKFFIRKELKEKGIEENLAKKILARYSPKEEINVAYNLIKRKINKYKNLKSLEKKQKIARYLATRGFSWEIINEVLNNF